MVEDLEEEALADHCRGLGRSYGVGGFAVDSPGELPERSRWDDPGKLLDNHFEVGQGSSAPAR